MTGGWTDTPLTARGQAQIAATATALQRMAPGSPVVSSDLQRTMQSAEIIGRAVNSKPVVNPLLREINTGAATGLTQAEADAIAQPPPSQFDPDWSAFEGAESYRALAERMARALALLEALGHERLIVVGHGVSGAMLLKQWLRLEPLQPVSLRLGPASPSEVRINEWNERQLVRLNVIDGPIEGN